MQDLKQEQEELRNCQSVVKGDVHAVSSLKRDMYSVL